MSGDCSRVIGLDAVDSTSLLSIDLSSDSSSFDFEAGFGSSDNIIASFKGLYDAIRGLGGLTLTSALGARTALDRINSNLQSLNLVRGGIGASQSRLGIASNLLGQQRAEVISASSRVSDVDIARESADVVRRQILQQTGASLLAQANQIPALSLSLLRG